MKKGIVIIFCGVSFVVLLLASFAICGKATRQKHTIQSFMEHRDLFEKAIRLYNLEVLEQRKAFWWERDDMEEECPEEIRELLEQTGFQGVRDWSGNVCFYKKENGVVSFGILYVPGTGAVSYTPFNQLHHIDGPWYYYTMDGTMI